MEADNLTTMKNMSYLVARDPSILAFHRPKLAQIKVNLLEEFAEVTEVAAQKHPQQPENIQVYLRIKKGNNDEFSELYEINEDDTLISKTPPGSNFLRNIREGDSMKRLYKFSKIFPPETQQTEVFNQIVKPKILEFINGQNSTLLTYGASGSGKTFTLIGTDTEPGIIPRSLEYLFRTLPHLGKTPEVKPTATGDVTVLSLSDRKKQKHLCQSLLNASTASAERAQHLKTYIAMQQRLSSEPVAELDNHGDVSIGVWVSFAEIYNEQIYDLLQLDPPRGRQRPRLRLGMNNGHVYIKNLTSVSVTSGQEAYQILQFGIHNLNYAPTQLNKHSSRSHSIFTIKLVQLSNKDQGTCVSSFNFCDLAGSERSKKTHNVGDRLKESNNINSSLLVLGRCISAIRNSQKNNDQKLVPFRESKLTQLFQRALSGEEDIDMIVNVSPSREMFDESQHVLNFSALAQEISIEKKPEKRRTRFTQLVEDRNNDEFTDYSEEDYQNVIMHLQDVLRQQAVDHEVTMKQNLDYMKRGYDELIDNLYKEETGKIERAQRSIKNLYETKLENQRNKYEQKIMELQENNTIIEIDCSDDEQEDAQKENRNPNNHSDDLEKKASTIIKLENRVHCLENQLQLVNSENAICERKIKELTETLDEGIREHRELLERYKSLELENVTLKEKCYQLERELDAYREHMATILLEERSSESEQEQEEEQKTI